MNVSSLFSLYLTWFMFSFGLPLNSDERVVTFFFFLYLTWFMFSFGLPLNSDERVVTFFVIPNLVHVFLWSSFKFLMNVSSLFSLYLTWFMFSFGLPLNSDERVVTRHFFFPLVYLNSDERVVTFFVILGSCFPLVFL